MTEYIIIDEYIDVSRYDDSFVVTCIVCEVSLSANESFWSGVNASVVVIIITVVIANICATSNAAWLLNDFLSKAYCY